MDGTDTYSRYQLVASHSNGQLLLDKLQGLVTNIKWSPEEVCKLFEALLKRFESTPTNDRSQLHSWMMKMLHCIEINYINPGWKAGKTVIELLQDKKVTDDEFQRLLAADKEKELEEILDEIRQQKLKQIDEKLLAEVKDIVSSVDKDLTSGNDASQRSGLKKELLQLCRAVQKTSFRPRLTQMVSWCLLALSKTGQLIQVGTGEGKSCIVAMFAAHRALRKQTVDIMSSSSVLAERDFKEWKKFYDILNISVACNTIRDVTGLKKCYEHQVVYGTVEDFAGNWLRHHFERTDILGERKFQCAIVDEVDSLMLDKGHHVVYIGSEMPALHHLNPLLAVIWATVNQYNKISSKTTVGKKYPFSQVVLENITKRKDVDEFTILQMAEDTGILAKGSVQDLRNNPSLYAQKTTNVTAKQLAEFFQTVERKFTSCRFALHWKNELGQIEEVNKRPKVEAAEVQRVPLLLISGGFCQYMYSDDESLLRAAEAEIKQTLHFTPCEVNHDKSSCYIPGFLRDLVESQLKVWIENAFKTKAMPMDRDYVIERHGIVPVDYSCTGVVENYMKWSDGLHQFLEMKHGSKLTDMTAITNYMSNMGMLQKYGDQIYGVSGTLGQPAEIETLQKIYEGIETCQIPSFKRRKLFEVEGVVVHDEVEWINTICDVVMAQIKGPLEEDKRAVLVICETIKQAKDLHSTLGYKGQKQKLYINNNRDNKKIFDKLEAGEVIIATNLAGRGTDLQVSDSVKKAGGLFVLQTFLPRNARVEAQAFGRTARQGSPGSAQLIVCSKHLSEPLQILILAKKVLSLLENIASLRQLYQISFLRQFRLYQNIGSEEPSNILLALSRSLTEKSSSGIMVAKEARDSLVAKKLSRYLESDIPKMKEKQQLFSQYLETLDGLYKSSNNKPADVSALNEFWGVWLITNVKENVPNVDLKHKLRIDLNTAIDKLQQRESPSSNLHHYTAFGNELRKSGHLARSIQMYTKAIQEDHCWAATAYYNRAFASLAQQDRRQNQNCISQALEDLHNALRSVELYCEQNEVTQKFSTQHTHNNSTTRLDRHMSVRHKVLTFFKDNIMEAIKRVNIARDLGRTVKVEESPVFFLLPLQEHFLAVPVLSTELVARDPLNSDPVFDILNEFNSLKSLGLTHLYTLYIVLSEGGFFSKIARAIAQAFD